MTSEEKCVEEIANAPTIIVSMLTYGSDEDWELGMEKMKRRKFLEEDMEQIYKKIEAETHPGKKATDSQKWLQEWAKRLAETVKSVREAAEKGDTSLYQATELMKISEPVFTFVCRVKKNSFSLTKEGEALLKTAEAQFREVVRMRFSDEEEADPEPVLHKCLQTMRKSIKAALLDKDMFEKWEKENTKPGMDEEMSSPKEEMEDIVSGEKNELEVISGYCRKDLEKIDEQVKELEDKTERHKKQRNEEVAELKERIARNKKEEKELREKLRRLEAENKDYESKIASKGEDCKAADKALTGAKKRIEELKKKIDKLLRKTQTSLDIIGKMDGVTKEILDSAEEIGSKMEAEAAKLKTASLSQLREALLAEMVLRQQNIDNMEANIQDMAKILKETEDELITARKRGFKPRIADLKSKKDNYTAEQEKTEKDLHENKKRQEELKKLLDEVDGAWMEFDSSVRLCPFDRHYKEFSDKYEGISPGNTEEVELLKCAATLP